MHAPHSAPAHMRFSWVPQGGRAAFTLLELMVVIAIIAIGAAVILPEMKGTYGDAQLRAASRELIDALTLASSQAVTFNRTHRFALQSQGHYAVEKQTGHRGSEKTFAPVKDVTGAAGKFDERLRVELRKSTEEPDPSISAPTAPRQEADERSPWVLFYPDGTADPAEFRITDAFGATLTFRLNPITARVELREPDQP